MSDEADDITSRAMVVRRCPVKYSAPSIEYYVNPAYLTPNLSLFGSIGDHCILSVLSYLDGISLIKAGTACRTLHELSKNDQLWLSLCRSQWHVSPDHLAVKCKVTGKDLYRFAQQQMQRVAREILEAQLNVPTWHLPSHTVQALTRSVFGGLG
ncbi:hypothetical protein H310_04057 [Aphanomyces invadans]|uniref:SRCR domain-containing protein n=1 Tax=Aphanomyces invadans TaxID=157072 RepID=A0A024UFE3_9STRA|nr:hypothetical protein H310_04057 [Aphanomyces invadans]ETW04989.1 hypothetical protein H310_04057 [Aphanomyces invadans]|eukprot:XP_008866427.1 hypothetical protein H310_04057 [Aphanomyces invadans]